MSCQGRGAAVVIRDAVHAATGRRPTRDDWHLARSDATIRGAADPDSPGPLQPLSTVPDAEALVRARAEVMFRDLNQARGAEREIDALVARILNTPDATVGQVEAMWTLGQIMNQHGSTPQAPPSDSLDGAAPDRDWRSKAPGVLIETVDLVDADATEIAFPDHAGLDAYPDIGMTVHTMPWLAGDPDTVTYVRRELAAYGHDPDQARFVPVDVPVTELGANPVEAYVMDGDDDSVDTITGLTDAYTAGADVPPLLVIDSGVQDPDDDRPRWQIVDGWHRASAALDADLDTVPCLATFNRSREWVTLADMAQPWNAGNNCHAAAIEIDRHLVEDVGLDPGWSSNTVEVGFARPGEASASSTHWANQITGPDGQSWVVDYTARQFDPDAPFPTVMPRADWLTWIDGRVQAAHGETVCDVTDH